MGSLECCLRGTAFLMNPSTASPLKVKFSKGLGWVGLFKGGKKSPEPLHYSTHIQGTGAHPWYLCAALHYLSIYLLISTSQYISCCPPKYMIIVLLHGLPLLFVLILYVLFLCCLCT